MCARPTGSRAARAPRSGRPPTRRWGSAAAKLRRAVLALRPHVTDVAAGGKRYAVEGEIIRDPKPSEARGPGAVVLQLDAAVKEFPSRGWPRSRPA